MEGKKPNRVLQNAGMCSHMEVNGNTEVVLEGCRGVLEYDTNVVRVRTAKTIIKFTGRGLVIKCLSADSLVVEGFLISIEFLV